MHRQVDTVDDTWLVAEPTPLKNQEFVNWDHYSQYDGKIIQMFQTTKYGRYTTTSVGLYILEPWTMVAQLVSGKQSFFHQGF